MYNNLVIIDLICLQIYLFQMISQVYISIELRIN
jgi:hypothetical protein